MITQKIYTHGPPTTAHRGRGIRGRGGDARCAAGGRRLGMAYLPEGGGEGGGSRHLPTHTNVGYSGRAESPPSGGTPSFSKDKKWTGVFTRPPIPTHHFPGGGAEIFRRKQKISPKYSETELRTHPLTPGGHQHMGKSHTHNGTDTLGGGKGRPVLRSFYSCFFFPTMVTTTNCLKIIQTRKKKTNPKTGSPTPTHPPT